MTRGPSQITAGPSLPWWDRIPQRLESELRELDEMGVSYDEDDAAKVAGVLRLRLLVPLHGDTLPLIATFPDNYPYFPVQVEAPTLDLRHHQHPFGKALCLLPRSTWWWNPASDGLARLLKERLERVVFAGSTMDIASAAGIEEHAPEPFTDYYTYQGDSLILIAAGESGREQVPPDATAGTVLLGIEGASGKSPLHPRFRGALLEVRGLNGVVLLRAPQALAEKYTRRIEGRWSRLPEPVRGIPLAEAAEAIYRAGLAADEPGTQPRAYETQQPGQQMRVRGVVFPEERRWRGDPDALGDGWSFVVRLQGPSKGPVKKKQRSKNLRGAPAGRVAPAVVHYLVRPGRYAPGDLLARAPELAPLRQHTIAVFGLGCIGAPSAFEFARASVAGLRLLDHDVVDPATTMRWPLGVFVAGAQKAPLLEQMLGAQYPYVTVHSEVHRVGTPRALSADGTAEDSEAVVLSRMLDGASLLYDATAEWGVQRFLAGLARDRGIPYVSVQGTPGGWGGVVVGMTPNRTEGCWICLQHWRGEALDAGGIPAPPSDVVHGDIHPEGCADPTYAAANMDLGEVTLMGVRTAIATLTANDLGGYPAVLWDVAVLSLRDSEGRLIAPSWTTYALRQHPSCAECAMRSIPTRST